MMYDMKNGWCWPHKICWILVIVGALNWGLIGALNLNLVNWAVGAWPMVERIVYLLVGLAGIMLIVGCRCSRCKVPAPEQKIVQ